MANDADFIEELFHTIEVEGCEEESGVADSQSGRPLASPLERRGNPCDSGCEFESTPEVSYRELLWREGIDVDPPWTLDDDLLSANLFVIIHGLSARNIFVENTDHLSDRELYLQFWQSTLDESVPDIPPEMEVRFRLDFAGRGSDDDIAIWLQYYATDHERANWARSWPQYTIPMHMDPPYNRDRFLPKPPGDMPSEG